MRSYLGLNKHFTTVEYINSHSALLLRNSDELGNLDLIFQGVVYMEVGVSQFVGCVRLASESELAEFPHEANRKYLNCYVLECGNSKKNRIVAVKVNLYKNRLDSLSSSLELDIDKSDWQLVAEI